LSADPLVSSRETNIKGVDPDATDAAKSATARDSGESRANLSRGETSGESPNPAGEQGSADHVVTALAAALREAAEAGRWGVVADLATELAAWRHRGSGSP
jgi:hypothetical protein